MFYYFVILSSNTLQMRDFRFFRLLNLSYKIRVELKLKCHNAIVTIEHEQVVFFVLCHVLFIKRSSNMNLKRTATIQVSINSRTRVLTSHSVYKTAEMMIMVLLNFYSLPYSIFFFFDKKNKHSGVCGHLLTTLCKDDLNCLNNDIILYRIIRDNISKNNYLGMIKDNKRR